MININKVQIIIIKHEKLNALNLEIINKTN